MKGLIRSAVIVTIALGLGCWVGQFLKQRPTPGENQSITARSTVPSAPQQDAADPVFHLQPSTLEDVDEALDAFVGGNDPRRAGLLVKHHLFNLPADQIPQVVEMFDARRPFDEEGLVRALFSRWAEFDPLAALAAAETWRNPLLGSIARHEANGAWVVMDPEAALAHHEADQKSNGTTRELWDSLANADPEKAFELAAKIENPEKRRQREEDINSRLQWHDPERAINWIMQHRDGEIREDLVGDALGSWAREAPEDVLAYLQNLPDSFHNGETFREIGGGVARTDQRKAIALLDEVPDEHRAAYLGGALRDMVYHYSDQVVEHLDLLPEGRYRNDVITELAERLSYLDVSKASQWINDLAPSRSRDLAVRTFARELTKTDPEAAAIWSTDIADERIRGGSFRETLSTWRKKNEAEAQAWLRSQPEEIRNLAPAAGNSN